MQIGLGYVNGLRKDDAAAVVEERERSGRFGSLAELASRAGIRDDALGRLAWAGACESIEPDSEGARREARRIALWRLGRCLGGGAARAALPPTPASRRSRAARARRLGGGGGGLRLDGHDARDASGRAPSRRAGRRRSERRPGGAARPALAGDRGRRGGAPAAGDGEGRSSSCCSRTRREWRT